MLHEAGGGGRWCGGPPRGEAGPGEEAMLPGPELTPPLTPLTTLSGAAGGGGAPAAWPCAAWWWW